jgi:2-polyprenyl-3-methyl-5-hydroxy-6-metoxy-1,4-benzoquinol methylase
LECNICGLKALNNFDHINDGFYEDSKMLDTSYQDDIVSWSKIGNDDAKRRARSFRQDIINKDILDFGCGTGDFIKYAKEYATSVSALEIDRTLLRRIKEEGITAFSSLEEIEENMKFDVIFLFHVLEHIKDPASLLKTLSSYLTKDGKIILEVPNSDDALISLYNCDEYKNFYYWKCHLYYFNSYTLKKVINKSALMVDFIKQIQRYPLSNHLYWLRQGEPRGHHIYNFLDSDNLKNEYEKQLASIEKCDTIIARISR